MLPYYNVNIYMVASAVLVIPPAPKKASCDVLYFTKYGLKAQGHDPVISVECALKYFSMLFFYHNRKSKQAVATCVVMTIYVFIFETRFL